MAAYKNPVSVLVIVHDDKNRALLLERAKHSGLWQSVTGSCEEKELPVQTAYRELHEETGLRESDVLLRRTKLHNVFLISPQWRYRYNHSVTHNLEHVFYAKILRPRPINISPHEHRSWCWLPPLQAAHACFSWSNREAILMLAHFSTKVPRALS